MFKCIECEYYSQRCYNVQRHMIIKHNLTIQCKDISKLTLNNIDGNLNNIDGNLNKIDGNLNKIDGNLNNILPNKCLQCHKVYTSKSNLTAHQKVCKGLTKDKECIYCHKILASKQSKERHQLTCKDKDKPTTIINYIDNSTNIDNSVTNNNNITINNFGNENLTYISDEMLLALTNNVDAQGMIDVIYFNDSHPENHNIELYSNKKQLYKNNSFSNVMNMDLAHNQMICKMVKLFMDKILEEEDMDQRSNKLHNLHYYNKTKSETVKLLSKHIYSQILSRTLQ